MVFFGPRIISQETAKRSSLARDESKQETELSAAERPFYVKYLNDETKDLSIFFLIRM